MLLARRPGRFDRFQLGLDLWDRLKIPVGVGGAPQDSASGLVLGGFAGSAQINETRGMNAALLILRGYCDDLTRQVWPYLGENHVVFHSRLQFVIWARERLHSQKMVEPSAF